MLNDLVSYQFDFDTMFDNNKLGEIRPNQLITTFGPGSIVDAVKDSFTVLDLNYWKEKGKKINRFLFLFISLSFLGLD